MEQHYSSDADFVGCVQTQRSITGSFGMNLGPSSCFPIVMLSNRQTCVSHTTPEAELVAMDTTLRVIAEPSHIMWDTMSHAIEPTVFGDNEAMLQVTKASMNPIARTHGVSVAWLHEVYKSGACTFTCKETNSMASDIFTKPFALPPPPHPPPQLDGCGPSHIGPPTYRHAPN